MRDVSERSLTLSYVIALTIIASLLVTCHIVLQGDLEISKRSSALINLTGRQRMLSQRIAGMAAEYRLGVPDSRQELVTATESFAASRQHLVADIEANTSRDLDQLSLRALVFDGSRPLFYEAGEFIQTARHIAALPPGDPQQPALTKALFAQAHSPLLSDLERVVALRQHAAEARVSDMQHLQSGILALALITLLIEALTIFRPMVRRIVDYNEELVILATTDQLTGIANRRSFIQAGESEIGRSRRYGRPLTFLALDLDHFKMINDRHGHAGGDKALKAVAQTLQQGLRSLDVLGRIGGEEFAILLPETEIMQAAQVAERLREAVARLQIKHSGKTIGVTISIGAVEVSPSMQTLSDAMSAADTALYRAKAAGRNRVVNAAA